MTSRKKKTMESHRRAAHEAARELIAEAILHHNHAARELEEFGKLFDRPSSSAPGLIGRLEKARTGMHAAERLLRLATFEIW